MTDEDRIQRALIGPYPFCPFVGIMLAVGATTEQIFAAYRAKDEPTFGSGGEPVSLAFVRVAERFGGIVAIEPIWFHSTYEEVLEAASVSGRAGAVTYEEGLIWVGLAEKGRVLVHVAPGDPVATAEPVVADFFEDFERTADQWVNALLLVERFTGMRIEGQFQESGETRYIAEDLA